MTIEEIASRRSRAPAVDPRDAARQRAVVAMRIAGVLAIAAGVIGLAATRGLSPFIVFAVLRGAADLGLAPLVARGDPRARAAALALSIASIYINLPMLATANVLVLVVAYVELLIHTVIVFNLVRSSAGIQRVASRHRSLVVILGMAIVTSLLPLIATAPPFNGFSTQRVWLDSFADAGIFVLLALGLNVVVGLAGLLDLGYAAFFAIGAYAYAYSASSFSGLHFPFWPMLIVGALIAATFGLLLGAPTLRLRGDYLAIVTLGFGEIVPVAFKNADAVTNGTNGIAGVDRPSLQPLVEFSAGNPIPYYITMAVVITVVMILLYRLQDSRVGRAWMAIREDELAAASNGVNTVSTKLLAFALGASTAGFAGVFSAAKLLFVSPDQFGFTVSFTIIAMIVLGGMGNMWGVAVGAFTIFVIQSVLLKQLTNFLRPLDIPVLSSIDFVQYQFLLYGVALVAMMLLRPEGLFPSQRRRHELRTVRPDDAADVSGPTPGAEMQTELR